ncbi:MAG: phenylpyruvate tautomerase [Rhodothermales bacterium]|jgi:phenylpyruvate tautomerase
MPLLEIRTNLVLSESEQSAFSATLSSTAAQLLSKPESYVMIIVNAGQHMRFGGSDAPTALLSLKSLGLPPRTAEYSAVLCDLLAGELGLDPARIYIEFCDPPRSHWGWNRATFG